MAFFTASVQTIPKYFSASIIAFSFSGGHLGCFELPQIVRTAQKGLNVGKYEVLDGMTQRERCHSSF